MNMPLQKGELAIARLAERKGLPAQVAYPMQEIAARLFEDGREGTLRHIMVVGAMRRVGTSFIVRGLADTLSSSGNRVLIVEVREDQPDRNELSRLLGDHDMSSADQAMIMRLGHDGVMTLMAPGSKAFEQVSRSLQERFEFVLWDMPPPSLATPTVVAARLMSGVVVVVQASRTTRRALTQVTSRLRESQGRMLGVVMNRMRRRLPGWLDGFV